MFFESMIMTDENPRNKKNQNVGKKITRVNLTSNAYQTLNVFEKQLDRKWGIPNTLAKDTRNIFLSIYRQKTISIHSKQIG